MRMKETGKSVKKRKKDSDLKENVVFNIQSIIMSVLMAITLVTIVTMGFLLYQRFKLAIDKMAVSNTEATVESTVDRVNSDLLDIRQIFDAANYNIVQEFDISSEKFAEQFSLLYEVITQSGLLSEIAISKPFKYISRKARSLTMESDS